MDYLRNILDNREISILIWLGIFFLWLLFKKDIRKSIKGIFKTLTQKVILVSLLLMCLYVGGVIYLLAYWGVWDIFDLSKTVIWFFGTAFAMLVNINRVGKEGYLRNVVVDNLKMVALIEFITNFYVFALRGELLLVPFLLVIGGMLGVASTDKNYKSIENILQKILILIGLVFLIYTVYNIIVDFNNFATWDNLLDFLLPLLLTLSFLPFIYLLAVYIMYDLVFNRINHRIKIPKLKRYAKWKTVLAFSVNLNGLNKWLQRIVLLELSKKEDVKAAIKEVKMRFYKTGAIYRVIKSTALYDSQSVDAEQLGILSVGAKVKPTDGKKVIQCHAITEDNIKLTLCRVEVIETGQTGFVLKKWLQREDNSKSHPLLRLWGYAGSHRREMVLASLYSILNKIFDLAPPLLIGAAVDTVVEQGDSLLARLGVGDVGNQLLVLAGLTVIIWGFESFFQYLYQVAWRNLAQTLQHDLRMDVYDHVQHLKLAYFEDCTTGGLLAVLNDDINQLERFLNKGVNDIWQVTTTVIVIGGIFFYTAPNVAWMAMLPMPVIIWGSIRFQSALAPKYAAVREQVGVLSGQLANNLGGIATIKSFTAESYELGRVTLESDHYRVANRDAIALSSAFVPLIRLLIMSGFIAILISGGQMALDGRLAVGAYSVLIFVTQRLLWPLTELGDTLDLYQRSMASTARALDLLDTDALLPDGEIPLDPEKVDGDIRLENVCFEYQSGEDQTVLRDLSLDIPAGETVGIVGATGAGKSTLVKLLLRFYDVGDGCLRLDGHDLRELRLKDLRRAIGFVSQDVYLFHGTVRENIAYGAFDATDEQITEAARIAEAHDFIMSLPQGYDTIVGERGQKLSGGQRQRISIARAVLKDPPVLILDEATSSVDNETEALIQRSLEKIAVGRTTIVIAHRLSTVRNADRIFILERGQLIEQGKHDELVKSGGVYAKLWGVQTGERSHPR